MLELYWTHPSNFDSKVQTYSCPYCNQKVAGIIHDLIKFDGNHPVLGNHTETVYSVIECPVCHRPSIYKYGEQITDPFGKALHSVSHVPEKINAVYEEVRGGIGAKCYTSAVILSRTALMHIAVEKGAPDNLSFQKYVDFICSAGYVPPNAKGWMDKIRKMGNGAVHDLEIWGQEDAELIGKFLMYLLIFIYELPSSI